MICPACGANNREDARFCRSCGKSLVEPPAVEVEPEIEAVEIPLGEPQFGSETAEPAAEEPLPEAEPEPSAKAPGDREAVAEPKAAAKPEAGGERETKDENTAPAEAAAAVPASTAAEPEEGEGTGDLLAEVPEPPLPAPEGIEEKAEADEAEPPPELEGDVVGFWREEPEPLAELEPGTVIAGRYVLVEALDVQDDEILYLARDLRRCWQCGFENEAPDQAFCARCGASMERKPDVQIAQVHDATSEPSGGEAIAARLEDEGNHFVLLAEPEPETGAETLPERQGIRLLVGQCSDVGQVRELDEDSLLALTLAPTYESRTRPVLGLFAVADGMGGHEGGEVASKLALQMLTERALETLILPELSAGTVPPDDVVARLRQATMAANDAVYLARQKAGNDMGTTLTAAYVRDDQLFLAHVGDCRAYRWNVDGLEQLTTDHSVIASMIDSGQAAPEEIYTHPHRSVIYRSIGDKATVEVDTDLLPLEAGDRLIFCCDGLWEMIRSEGIADVMMQEADPQVACDVMVKRANAAGGEDNISVIVVQIEAT